MKRPVLRYFGGKFLLAPWIIEHFPKHRIYVEPFGGAGSVLMQKERTYAEVWNDINDSVWSLFNVLRDKKSADRLHEAIQMTPYSRREFELAHCVHPDPIERARRLIIRSFMGFGADSASNINSKTSFRADSNKSGSTPAHDWVNYAKAIPEFAERLHGVIIENDHALNVMADHDSAETLHYIDPPYPLDARGDRHRYNFEMTLEDHAELIRFVKTLKGFVIISGYQHPIYDGLGWHRIDRKTFADGARERIECLWLNPKTQEQQKQRSLFEISEGT